ncbi:ATP-binding protein [Paludisphaera sp.]|uniref:ATP-binding protein n=1 Tax=Paludisphaera sp. TaxID=2017432 RepID=UPI00301BEBDE
MEVVILVGLQGSGNSTLCRERYAATHVLVSKDLFRNNRRPQRRQMQLIEEALREGKSVVVDNTNATVEDRAAILALARSLGASVACVDVRTPIGECLRRNAAREGRARVPEKAVWITSARMRRPTLAEGFDRLERVGWTGEGTR